MMSRFDCINRFNIVHGYTECVFDSVVCDCARMTTNHVWGHPLYPYPHHYQLIMPEIASCNWLRLRVYDCVWDSMLQLYAMVQQCSVGWRYLFRTWIFGRACHVVQVSNLVAVSIDDESTAFCTKHADLWSETFFCQPSVIITEGPVYQTFSRISPRGEPKMANTRFLKAGFLSGLLVGALGPKLMCFDTGCFGHLPPLQPPWTGTVAARSSTRRCTSDWHTAGFGNMQLPRARSAFVSAELSRNGLKFTSSQHAPAQTHLHCRTE
jgi:hypothetical protein